MEIHVNEQVKHALQAKAEEGHYPCVEEYVEALLRREAGQNTTDAGSDLERFHQALHQAGLLLSSKTPAAVQDVEPFEPITISGTPISATIIAERR
jgi:hypothetical protein